ncbi:MAG: radical SAM protein, partial [Endomicrobia bacterium]|nr:radical SAM protein [Endomicrobiia bacterium]
MSKKNTKNVTYEKLLHHSESITNLNSLEHLMSSSTHSGNYLFHSNWYQQIKNRIKDFRKINQLLNLTIEEQRGFLHTKFKFAITPFLLRMIDEDNEHCPIRRQFIPTIDEIKTSPEELNQNNTLLQENFANDNLIPSRLVRKYLDTLTIFLTDQCAAYCRFCSNRHFVGNHEYSITHGEYGLIIKYLKEHTEISHVILSGGDPLSLSDEKLEFYISQLRKIQHISVVFIETRIPVVLPQRITPKLCNILKKYQPIYVNIMFNHPKEISLYTECACKSVSY